MDFFSSDWHLGHQRIIELCDRPFSSTDEMNAGIIERANDAVTEKDRLFLLGDNVMGPWDETVQLLRGLRAGRVVLLPGNHDRWSLARMRVDRRRDLDLIKAEASRRVVEGLRPGVRALEDVGGNASWTVRLEGGTRVQISHYPWLGTDDGDGDRNEHLDPLKPLDWGAPLVHGHVHGLWAENGRMMNVGVDVRDFTPVPAGYIEDWAAGLEPQGSGPAA